MTVAVLFLSGCATLGVEPALFRFALVHDESGRGFHSLGYGTEAECVMAASAKFGEPDGWQWGVLVPCRKTRFVEGKDFRVDLKRKMHVARSAAVAEAMCVERGADYATHRARVLGDSRAGDRPGGSFGTGALEPSPGCWDPRDDVIIVEREQPGTPPGLLDHELKHRREGAWHD